MQNKQDFTKEWTRADPIQQPIIKDMPPHEPERFVEYTELKNAEDQAIGFALKDREYFYDASGGWRDEKGCYYDKDGQPAGWFVLHPGDEYHEHFYDLDGMYVPTDIESDKSSSSEEEEEQVSDEEGDKEELHNE